VIRFLPSIIHHLEFTMTSSFQPMRRRLLQSATVALSVITMSSAFAFDGAELYAGERALYAEAAKEGLVVSFDTGPEWANWKVLFREFKKRYPEVEMTYNDLGSAATVVALDKSRRRPQADTAYYFAASAVDAVKKDVVAPFKPINFEKLPDVFRETEGRWFTIHTLNIAFLVNKKLVKEVPQSWADLLKPEFKNSVVYLDPRSTGVGQVGVFAAAFGNGGNMDNTKPGTDWFGKLHAAGNVLRVEGTTPYAKFLKGEIPVWIGYENDGLKAKHVDGMGDAVEVVIPKEASVAAPYAISFVKGAPNPNAGKLWLNFTMSEFGQTLFAQGFVRPAVPGVNLPADVRAKMPDAPQMKPLDVVKAAAKKADIDRDWAAAALAR
jgi:putative spermidine/putrescine transport system substrate-binding protein